MELQKLLKPRTVAIVGASEKAGFGGDTTRNYLKFSKNLDGLYLVNPGRDTIFGRRAYHSLSEIEGDVDLVIFCHSVHSSEDDYPSVRGSGGKKLWRRGGICQRLQ